MIAVVMQRILYSNVTPFCRRRIVRMGNDIDNCQRTYTTREWLRFVRRRDGLVAASETQRRDEAGEQYTNVGITSKSRIFSLENALL